MRNNLHSVRPTSPPNPPQVGVPAASSVTRLLSN
jgi:hypothetical protein